MPVQTLKGFRDFLPAEARKRQYVADTLKKVFESYGFEPLETPALEYQDVLLGKYGEEGDKLMYKFKDNGDRDVALRYDQTVPTARVVAQYQNELPMPFKRYQVQPVWRAENTQKGRYREFLQCDADIIGSSSPLADAEILAVVYNAYKELGLDIVIKINDRALLKDIPMKALPTLDKLNKIGEEGVLQELESKGFSKDDAESLLSQAKALQPSEYLMKITQAYEEMECPKESLVFDGTLIRGLDYYTGLIFEVVLQSNQTGSSLCGGGRYDNLIGMFAGKQIPAVGFAVGFDRTLEAMEEASLFPENVKNSSTQVLVATFFDSEVLISKALETATNLRNNDITTEVYLMDSPLEKQLKYADAKKIPYVVIIGLNEIEKGEITLRDMIKREQKQLTLESLIELFRQQGDSETSSE